jgi:hypothetical protein
MKVIIVMIIIITIMNDNSNISYVSGYTQISPIELLTIIKIRIVVMVMITILGYKSLNDNKNNKK